MTDLSNVEMYTYQWFMNRFIEAKDETVSFCQPIGEDLFVRRPAEDVWSIAECYSHLNEFGQQYLDNIRRGMKSATKVSSPHAANQAFPPRLIWKGVVKLFAPPYRIKMKTVKPFVPQTKADLKKQAVLDRFINLQDEFIEELKTAQVDSVDLNNTKVSNPLLKFVKMTLAECFAVTEVHQRRHIWQAEQILKRIE